MGLAGRAPTCPAKRTPKQRAKPTFTPAAGHATSVEDEQAGGGKTSDTETEPSSDESSASSSSSSSDDGGKEHDSSLSEASLDSDCDDFESD